MKCFFCDTEVRWNNDFDSEDIDPDSEYTITSMYECDNCKAWYEVSTNKKETKWEHKNKKKNQEKAVKSII